MQQQPQSQQQQQQQQQQQNGVNFMPWQMNGIQQSASLLIHQQQQMMTPNHNGMTGQTTVNSTGINDISSGTGSMAADDDDDDASSLASSKCFI